MRRRVSLWARSCACRRRRLACRVPAGRVVAGGGAGGPRAPPSWAGRGARGKGPLGAQEGQGEDEQLAQHGGDNHLGRFALGPEPLSEGAQARVGPEPLSEGVQARVGPEPLSEGVQARVGAQRHAGREGEGRTEGADGAVAAHRPPPLRGTSGGQRPTWVATCSGVARQATGTLATGVAAGVSPSPRLAVSDRRSVPIGVSAAAARASSCSIRLSWAATRRRRLPRPGPARPRSGSRGTRPCSGMAASPPGSPAPTGRSCPSRRERSTRPR